MPEIKTLKEARRTARLTQAALAQRSGVSQQCISDLESSPTPNPTIAVVQALEKALRCRLRFPRHASSDGRAA